MRIALIEAQPALEELHRRVLQWAEERQIPLVPAPAVFDSTERFLRSFAPELYDVILLNVSLENPPGMAAARKIREADEVCRLVFTAPVPDYAVESYEVHASWYLVTPCSYERLCAALDRCGAAELEQNQFLTVPAKGGEQRLYLHEIVCAEYLNRRVHVELIGGETRIVPMTQGEFSALLLRYPYFCDCMRGTLVNLEMVEQLLSDRFRMKNGRVIPVSRLKYQAVRRQLREFSYRKARRT